MIKYYADEQTTLYHGDCREVIPQLGLRVDLVVADPPYGETSLQWDRWPDDWPLIAATAADALWCFGSMRMFMERGQQFTGHAGWKLSQDIVWEKHNGSGLHADRFRRVHEFATHWYRGPWADQHKDVPTTDDVTGRVVRTKGRPGHMGSLDRKPYVSEDGGPRLMRSVLAVRSMHGKAIHPTEKPVGVLDPLIRYACPVGGIVLDPFAGSGSTAAAARLSGRRAVLIEADEKYCQAIARRLQQGLLEFAAAPATTEDQA